MVKNNDEHGYLIDEREEELQRLANFRKQVKLAIGKQSGSDDDAIAQIKELADIKAKVALGDIPVIKEELLTDCGFVNGLAYSQILERLQHLSDFHSRSKQLLADLIGKDLTDDDAIAEIKRLIIKQVINRDIACRSDDKKMIELQLVADSIGKNLTKDEAIAEVKRLQSLESEQKTIADLWTQIKQVVYKKANTDIRCIPDDQVIRSIQYLQDTYDKNRLDMENLAHDLRVSQKVIARLVSE